MNLIKYQSNFVFLIMFVISTSQTVAQVNSQAESKIFKSKASDILSQIYSLEDVSVKKIDIELSFTQPVDHHNPDEGSFEQRVFLIHKDISKPVVLWLEGYAFWRRGEQEITKLLDANQIIVEHRYFGESKPDSLQWEYLTIQQAAADHHRIMETFKEIYPGKWINSGISKGGQTTMYHRRFYPNDVDASVCYVAPLNFSDEEPLINDFLEEAGSEDCRDSIMNFQKLVLSKKAQLLLLFQEYSNEKNYTYKIGLESAFEYCVLEYTFAFWQWHKWDCSEIPDDSADIQDIFDHFIDVSNPYYFSDKGIAYYAPFFCQALSQIGYYGYDATPFRGLLTAITNPTFKFCAPEGSRPVFDPAVMTDIHQWITTEGNNMIFIYGELDPWSASSVQLTGQTNALKMVRKDGDHSTRIKDFPSKEKNKIFGALEDWLEVEIVHDEE